MDTVYEVAAGAEGVDVREQMFQCLMSYGIGESHLAMDRFYHSLREISTFINVQNRIKLLQYRDLESAYQSKILEKDELLVSARLHFDILKMVSSKLPLH
ncbi:hypothetical protein EON65_00865 [archaeon]|nr:MAG: hypothetical protein EON65_00865 [archaeon]